jgi:hypothetical protein
MCCNPIVDNSMITKDMALTVCLKGVTGNHDKGGGLWIKQLLCSTGKSTRG